MPLPFAFDFKNPDYDAVFAHRIATLARIRAAVKAEKENDMPASIMPDLYGFYRNNIAQFIIDWGVTFDPRNVERGLPALVPFLLFPKQEEWVNWFVERWKKQEGGATEKSRDEGLSWLSVSATASMCLFNDGVVIGFGSRKEEYVDKLNSPKALFWKARMFIEHVPIEFRGAWRRERDAPYMRITFPMTGSYMTGEAGDNIGRGDRTSVYIVDEAAYLERPELADAALSNTTNCRVDISSANGTANPFYEKVKGGKVPVFTFSWRDDPRKDEAWYAKQVNTLSAVVVAQEIDINYSASVEGIIIPSAWVQSAVDAHRKIKRADGTIGFPPSGAMRGALDVADQGVDMNAWASAHGVVLNRVEAWSGKGDDIFGTVDKAFNYADQDGVREFDYDADGLGAGVRGDARVINERRKAAGQSELTVRPFRGSGEVVNPDAAIPSVTPPAPGERNFRTNGDFFANWKAQAWWSLRVRFQLTHRAVVDGILPDSLDDLISLPAEMTGLQKLMLELSQPTYSLNNAGKVLVDKAPDGQRSPNHGDGVMMLFAPKPKKAVGFFS